MKGTWRLCTSAGQRICDVTPNDIKLIVNWFCPVLTSSPTDQNRIAIETG